MSSVILVNPKYPHNVAAAIRACSCFDIPDLLWTGSRVNPAEYTRLPREERMKGYADVKWQNVPRPFDIMSNCIPVCVELSYGSVPLETFIHPVDAAYVFGPEDGDVPQVLKRHCHYFVHIESKHCLNLAAAINVILYHRARQFELPLNAVEHEKRGEIQVAGWEGR